MHYKVYKNYCFIMCFLLFVTNTIAHPGRAGDLFINLNSEKYNINYYSFTKKDSINNTSELIKLKVALHTQNKKKCSN